MHKNNCDKSVAQVGILIFDYSNITPTFFYKKYADASKSRVGAVCRDTQAFNLSPR